ncbi:MAG: hypothetical protein EOP04_20710 [Proteobacteria bacterium]|nr:MAG: hypothetical protein EOP04_20710 [Pseudomonadota bacterium]
MSFKNFVFTCSLVAILSSFTLIAGINRGSVRLLDGKVTVQNLRENEELRAARVKEKDVLKSICDLEINDFASYGKADGILQKSTSCVVKVIRNDVEILLSYSR